MSTVGVSSEISLSTKNARTSIHKFYKAISTDSSTLKTLNLEASASGALSLANSVFIIIVGLEDSLTITLTDNNNGTLTIENSGFVMMNASNLYSVEILNNHDTMQEISLIF